MSSLFFPQLNGGATAQYPIRKSLVRRTIQNVTPDGHVISLPDAGASSVRWDLEYNNICSLEAAALKAHFDACVGALNPFTFLDPTGNLLVWSADLTNSLWLRSPLIKVVPHVSDPNGTNNGFTLTNGSQKFEQIFQTLQIPASYWYSFSLYASSPTASTLTLLRNGAVDESRDVASVNTGWKRVQSSGRLNDGGTSFSVGLSLAPGQSVSVYGPQLEAQACPSPYKETRVSGSVYPECFWTVDELSITADGPGVYSTAISLESRA